MSLLDEESENIKKSQEARKGKKRMAKSSGLNRFQSLNKYKSYADEYRKKNVADTTDEPKILETPKMEVKPESTPPLKKPPPNFLPEANLTPEPSNPSLNNTDKSILTKEIEHEVIAKVAAPEPKPALSIDYKETTNSEQIDFKTDYQESTNRLQTAHKATTNRPQIAYTTDYKQVTEQITNSVRVNPKDLDIRILVGMNEKLLNLFFQDCKRQGSLITGRYTIQALRKLMEDAHSSTVKTVIHRLAKGGFIERLPGKKGRAGWLQVAIPKRVYDQLTMLENSGEKNLYQGEIDYKQTTQQVTEQTTNAPSSSSILNLNKTTTTSDIDNNWKMIQIPASLKELGISMAHVLQVAGDGILTAEEVQNSLDGFAYDFAQGKINATFGPLRLLMGVLRKQKVPYVSQALIESEKKAMDDYLRIKREVEEIKKYKDEMALVEKFNAWWNTLSQEEKNKVCQPSNFAPEGSDMQTKLARGEYLNNPKPAP